MARAEVDFAEIGEGRGLIRRRLRAGAFRRRVRSRVVPRYRLIDEEGEDLGLFQAATPNGAPGDRIPRGPGNSLFVVNVTEAFDGDDVDGYLVVKAAE
jgi:hypothetical protein